jgi:1-acyl-sn-glycerol-3-phosphate acyltransferase
MNHYRHGPPPRWWEPRLSPWLVKRSRGLRKHLTRRMHRVTTVHVHNQPVVRAALQSGKGILIAPNHSSHADPHAIYDAMDIVGTPVFIMATWHVFDVRRRLGQWMLQKIGCFSVDRDGADLKALKEAIRILQSERFPLVIFPEGEIYHCNDRVTPFLEGAATIASTAVRKSDRELVIIPCAMKYQYVEKPHDELLKVMTELEEQILWRPRHHKELKDRIYDFSEAVLSLKEIEILGASSSGSLPDRVRHLASRILARHEQALGIEVDGKSIPERVREIRRRSIKEICDEENPVAPEQRIAAFEQLDDAYLVGQLFSYPGNYVAESPTFERMAETIDKFEEDALKRPSAGIRGSRHCHVYFGEPIPVSADRKSAGSSPAEVTRRVEDAVQKMLDAHAERHAKSLPVQHGQ